MQVSIKNTVLLLSLTFGLMPATVYSAGAQRYTAPWRPDAVPGRGVDNVQMETSLFDVLPDVSMTTTKPRVVVPMAVKKNAAVPASVDTTKYSPYTYIRFLRDDAEVPELTDEEFYDIAGRVIFPVNKYYLPKRDSLIMQLQNEVLPLINRDSLELASLMIRGAASPEGPTRFNKFLGEHRAATLLQFLRDNIDKPINEADFDMHIDIEDYRTLCIMMHRASDKDYPVVQTLCDRYLPKNNIAALKHQLQTTRQGTLWRRLLRQYFPRLRAARVILFFRAPRTYGQRMEDVLPSQPVEEPVVEPVEEPIAEPDTLQSFTGQTGTDQVGIGLPDTVPTVLMPQRVPRRELLSVKSNLLFDFAYMPGYDRWCPIPNVAIEYYPLHGHFTVGASFDCPWWQHYWDHKFFQIRNYQVEGRYYFRSGDIRKNPPGQGAAFRGLYLQAYAHMGLFGICFDANHGWEGEGAGAGLGVGYVLPLGKRGHWRLEFGLQAGYFRCKYDPYQFENPVDPNYIDHLYYYKWTLSPDLFKRRQYRFSWFGPTRVGITLTYDLLYRRQAKRGISFKAHEMMLMPVEGENVINVEPAK